MKTVELVRTVEFVVESRDSGFAADVIISGHAPELARRDARRLIQNGSVRLDGRPTTRNVKLSVGATVAVEVPIGDADAPKPAAPLTVVYEDDELLVVDKPAGVVVHPAYHHPDGTLFDALVLRASGEGRVAYRPGLVHRLDKDTSGLLLVTKTPLARREIQRQLDRGGVAKVYLALVAGHPGAIGGVIDAPLGPDPRDRRRSVVRSDGKAARTRWRTERVFRGYTLLELTLETGRTHQIRAHLEALGTPVVGDPIYGVQESTLGLSRQFLHAHRLIFVHPIGRHEMRLCSPLPAELSVLLTRLS